MIYPTRQHTVTSPFGPRGSPCAGCSSSHQGTDFGSPEGEPIHAVLDGIVSYKGVMGGYGNYLCRRHGALLSTCYAHQSRFASQSAGGYVVAPPSIHPTGPRYTWQTARDLEHLKPSRLPPWLYELAAPPIPTPATRGRAARHDDPLREIPAAEYVLALTGRTANRAGYVRCPLPKAGQERTPSLRLYQDAGWYCYGCHTGGDIFTLAALLRGLRPPLRGTDFLTVQATLREHFAPPPATRASRAPQTATRGA